MAKGIFRTADDWVQVDYGTNSAPIPRSKYEDKGYKPPFETLPLESEYYAAQKKTQDDT
jgi:hypothetical protein